MPSWCPKALELTLGRVFEAPLTGEKSLSEKEGLNADEINQIKRLREIISGNDLQAEVLKQARVLEGSVRGTGVHAAGIIIAPKDLTSKLFRLLRPKTPTFLLHNTRGRVIEDAGVIKMDFLGLKTPYHYPRRTGAYKAKSWYRN